MTDTLRQRKQLEKETDNLDKLIAAKEEKLRKLKELEDKESKGSSELDKRLSSKTSALDPQLQQLLESGNNGRKNKRISPELQSALKDLLALEADILERKKRESGMTEKERDIYKADIKRWEKASQLLMMEMMVSEVKSRHRPRRYAHLCLLCFC